MDYFEFLEYYESNRLKINTQNNANAPTKDDILKFLLDLNIRYQNLKEAYEPLTCMVSGYDFAFQALTDEEIKDNEEYANYIRVIRLFPWNHTATSRKTAQKAHI